MKLLVTSDDYGFTYAVTDGVLHCARNGILTETGLFSNMNSAPYAAKRMIEEFPNICLGIDINLVAGSPVSNPKMVPSMVQESGEFKSSGMHRKLDETMPDHIPYEEAYLEIMNQTKRFIELTGKKPEYFNGHSYSTPTTRKAMVDVAKELDIPMLSDILKQYHLLSGAQTAVWNVKPFSLEAQLACDPIGMFKEGKLTYLDEAYQNDGIAHIHVHAGFIDQEVFRYSTYTVVRTKDLELITAPEMIQWVKDHNVELISVRDLLEK